VAGLGARSCGRCRVSVLGRDLYVIGTCGIPLGGPSTGCYTKRCLCVARRPSDARLQVCLASILSAFPTWGLAGSTFTWQAFPTIGVALSKRPARVRVPRLDIDDLTGADATLFTCDVLTRTRSRASLQVLMLGTSIGRRNLMFTHRILVAIARSPSRLTRDPPVRRICSRDSRVKQSIAANSRRCTVTRGWRRPS